MSERFIPTVTTGTGGALARSDPAAQADFLRQHIRRGWSEREALARYRRWEACQLETNPFIPRMTHHKARRGTP